MKFLAALGSSFVLGLFMGVVSNLGKDPPLRSFLPVER